MSENPHAITQDCTRSLWVCCLAPLLAVDMAVLTDMVGAHFVNVVDVAADLCGKPSFQQLGDAGGMAGEEEEYNDETDEEDLAVEGEGLLEEVSQQELGSESEQRAGYITPPVVPSLAVPAGTEVATPPLELGPALKSGAKWMEIERGAEDEVLAESDSDMGAEEEELPPKICEEVLSKRQRKALAQRERQKQSPWPAPQAAPKSASAAEKGGGKSISASAAETTEQCEEIPAMVLELHRIAVETIGADRAGSPHDIYKQMEAWMSGSGFSSRSGGSGSSTD